MTIVSKQTLGSTEDREYWVIAVIPADKLPRLRTALETVALRSVTVSSAVSWSGSGREYTYRGQRHRSDKDVMRVEIACAERDVDGIVSAVEGVVGPGDRSARADAVVAFPITHVAAHL